ncbi:MAG TPA: carboxypeptidase regulatory-like domain-containing protein, partial [Chryseolinea sp.]|nr:carboxypeptidase regulatory-like domain-containing protein [Chryseolinea sp.]
MTWLLSKFRFLLLVLFVGTNCFGQGTDINISGSVSDTSGLSPLQGATVKAHNESTGFSTTVMTNTKGIFRISNLPVGSYTILVSFTGYQSKEIKGNVLNLGDHLNLPPISLEQGINTLNTVVVSASSFRNAKDKLGASTTISGKALQKLPLQSRNYLDLTVLSPLSGPNGSLGGTKVGGTGYLIDGVSNRRTVFGQPTEGAFPMSLENIREFEVETNSYDVTNGRGSGGVVKAITKSGSNTFSGAAWGYYAANSLAQDKDVFGKEITTKYETIQTGVSSSGPIIKNKLFYLVSFDYYKKTSPFRAYDFDFSGATLAQAEKNLGITKANLDQVISTMQSQLGFADVQQYGAININQTTKNFMLRLDWNLTPKNLLTLRYNHQSFIDPNKLKSNGLLSTQYIGDQADNSFFLSLRTDISTRASNDLKLNYISNYRNLGFLYNRLPEGFVDVVSTFEDGSTSTKQVSFGNQNWVPEKTASSSFQLIDNYRIKFEKFSLILGTDNIITKIKDKLTHDQQGQFFYASLADLATNTPYRFNRKIALNPVGDCNCNVIELGAYAQVETDLTPELNLTAGLRWDGTIISNPPVYNPLLESITGLDNHVVPFDYRKFQPRVNLTWDIRKEGKNIVKAGAGLFASQFTTQAITFSHIDNGIDFRQVDARTPNGNVPAANWVGYQSDYSLVPGVDYYNSLAVKPPATITLMDKNLKTPSTFKVNLSYYRYIKPWLRAGVNLYYNRTENNFYLMDQNVKRTPEFLTNEGRGVYVPAASLTAGSKLTDYNQSRAYTDFNQIRMFTNTPWASTFKAVSVEVAASFGKGGQIAASYTRGEARGTPNYDNGDPRNANMNVGYSYWDYSTYARNGFSGEDQKHKAVLMILSPSFFGFNISSSMVYYQANRFSAFVNIDANGDGNVNDLAFVYDPSDKNTPAAIATGMTDLLAKTSPQFRKYLLDNMGQFATNNGGLMP